jgi:glycosyltransferase involved in cell wall biosynthesis
MATFRYLPFMGGVELHVDEVSRRLADRGVDVTILTTDPTGALPERERRNGVDVIRVRAWPTKEDYYFAPRVYSEIVGGSWDIVHVHAYHTFVGPLAMLGARRAGLPYVLTFHAGGHSSRFRHAMRPLQVTLLRPLLASADRLIALAPHEIDHYAARLRLPRERFALIPNGSDLPTIAADGRRSATAPLIASVGRLERYKGHHRVLAAFPHVLRRRPEARLWIAGSGPYESRLQALVEQLEVSGRVEIRSVPVHERERWASELSRVHVVALLSEFEAQPIAALEALALGCRLIVADRPGLDVLAEQGLAHAVPLESSPEDVAAAILEGLDEQPVADPPALPTWDECADALLGLYASVLDNRRSQVHSDRTHL